MDKIIQLTLETYGISGMVMLSPLLAVVYLWRENQSLTQKHSDELAKLNASRVSDSQKCVSCPNVAALNEIQNQRVKDAQQIGNKLIQVMSEQSALNQQTNSALEQLGNVLSLQSAASQKNSPSGGC